MAGALASSKAQHPAARSNMPEMLTISGTINTNGASPSRAAGKGYVVTQQGTGLYRIALNINSPRIVSVKGLLIKATTSATFLELQDALATNNYVTFRVVNASGTAVAPGAVGDQISFDITIMVNKLSVV
jgi:hypothetical protein